MKRREFISLLGGAAVWPVAARLQPNERMRQVGVLLPLASGDSEGQARIEALLSGLQQLGWDDGHNLRIIPRWGAGNAERTRQFAEELVSLSPDVLVASTSITLPALLKATQTIPIVFVQVVDPVGAGFVDSLARPGNNATGFTTFEYGISGKWLELLKQIAPGVTRVAILRDSSVAAGSGQFGAIQSIAPAFGVELRPMDVRDVTEIERAITRFARGADSGVIVTASPVAAVNRNLIIRLAERLKLPAVYSSRFWTADGGLISYGADRVAQYRQAAQYVDRILKGEKPADLPVQAPTKYELVINLKTAKALGLEVPPALLATADEVIE
jgi:ABC-type uncharacterized transport system substrate-binding protein